MFSGGSSCVAFATKNKGTLSGINLLKRLCFSEVILTDDSINVNKNLRKIMDYLSFLRFCSFQAMDIHRILERFHDGMEGGTLVQTRKKAYDKKSKKGYMKE